MLLTALQAVSGMKAEASQEIKLGYTKTCHERCHTVQDLRSLFEGGSPGRVLDFSILQVQGMLTCMLVSLAPFGAILGCLAG